MTPCNQTRQYLILIKIFRPYLEAILKCIGGMCVKKTDSQWSPMDHTLAWFRPEAENIHMIEYNQYMSSLCRVLPSAAQHSSKRQHTPVVYCEDWTIPNEEQKYTVWLMNTKPYSGFANFHIQLKAELWLCKLWNSAEGQALALWTLIFGQRSNSDFQNFIILPTDDLWLSELSSNHDLQTQTPKLNFFFSLAGGGRSETIGILS